MAENLLDGAKVCASFEQVCGRTVPETVRPHVRCVRHMLQPRGAKGGGPKATNLVSQLATCAKCGLPATGDSDHGKLTYACRAECCAVLRKVVDEAVTFAAIARLERPDAIEEMVAPGSGRQDAAKPVRSPGQMATASATLKERLDVANTVLATSGAGQALTGLVGPDAAVRWAEASLSRKRSVIAELFTITLHPAKDGGERVRIVNR